MTSSELSMSSATDAGIIDLTSLAKTLPDPEPTVFAYDPITVHG